MSLCRYCAHDPKYHRAAEEERNGTRCVRCTETNRTPHCPGLSAVNDMDLCRCGHIGADHRPPPESPGERLGCLRDCPCVRFAHMPELAACRFCRHGMHLHGEGKCNVAGCPCGAVIVTARGLSGCPGCGRAAPEHLPACPVLLNGQALKDSGQHVRHATGAVRDSAAGRGRYDLISPITMHRLAVHLERGAAKYEERNWEKGLPIGRMFASLFRHSWQAFMQETDEDHLAAVICNAMFIMHTLEMIARNRLPASLNDLPDYRKKDA